MYNVIVKEIPEQPWFSDLSKKVVKDFNDYAKEHNARLVLSLYSEPESESEFEVMLDNGYYDYEYQKDNPHSASLEEMVIEAEERARFLGFDTSDIM